MRLSIIIVNWNVQDLLDSCLASIFAADLAPGSFEIILVDSASDDDSVAMVREKYPAVRLLAQAENVGFTRGNNIGLARARGDYLLLLNPDTEVSGGALGLLVDYLDANPGVGIVGPHTLNSDGSHQSTRRRFPNADDRHLRKHLAVRLRRPPASSADYRMLDTNDDDILDGRIGCKARR